MIKKSQQITVKKSPNESIEMDEVSIGNNQIYENKQDTYDIRTIRSLIGVICCLY